MGLDMQDETRLIQHQRRLHEMWIGLRKSQRMDFYEQIGLAIPSVVDTSIRRESYLLGDTKDDLLVKVQKECFTRLRGLRILGREHPKVGQAARLFVQSATKRISEEGIQLGTSSVAEKVLSTATPGSNETLTWLMVFRSKTAEFRSIDWDTSNNFYAFSSVFVVWCLQGAQVSLART